MADDAAYLTCAVLLIAAAVKIRRPRRTAALKLWCSLVVTGAAAAVCLAPASVQLLRRAEPTDTLALLLGDGLKLAAACQIGLLGQTTEPARLSAARVRRWAAAGAACLTAMIVLYLAAGLPFVDATAPTGRSRAALVGYDVVFMLFTVTCLAVYLRHTWRHTREAPRGVVRAGLCCWAVAVIVALAWSAWTVDDIRAVLATGRQSAGEDTVSAVLEAVCALAGTAGTTLSAWGGLVWWRAWRDFRALTPLWDALHEAVPGIVLDAAPRFPLPWQAPLAHYRRVIEIHDGIMALRPYRPIGADADGDAETDAETGSRSRDPARDPVSAEAAAIAAAIEARWAGVKVPRQRGGAGHGEVDHEGPGERSGTAPTGREPTLAAESAWLVRVARELVTSGAVAADRRAASITTTG